MSEPLMDMDAFMRVIETGEGDTTKYEMMISGQPVELPDPYIMGLQVRAAAGLKKFNELDNSSVPERMAMLADLLGSTEDNFVISPITWEYGQHIRLGKRVFINMECVFLDGAPIVLEEYVAVGPRVMFLTAGHPLDPELRIRIDPESGAFTGSTNINKPIHVGKKCWIGAGAIIIGGVTIGEGTTIGAGSVVTKSIPPYVFAAGNPCRVIRELDRPEGA